MIIPWSDRYSMGVEEIDNDHKQLFQIAGKLIQTVNQNIDDSSMRFSLLREGMAYLKDYFDVHAVREEAYMRQIAFEGYFQHKRLHDEFRDIQLVKYQTILQQGQCTKDEILEFVGGGIGWLFERTLAGRFISDSTGMKYQESHFLTQQQLAQQFTKHRPTLSVLFSSDQGSFFVSSDDKQIFK